MEEARGLCQLCCLNGPNSLLESRFKNVLFSLATILGILFTDDLVDLTIHFLKMASGIRANALRVMIHMRNSTIV